jgi:putative MATE family efflux protein
MKKTLMDKVGRSKYSQLFGDRDFYRHVLMVVLPMIIQNTLSNVVSLLDNVMVGQVGTLPMSAVAIDNQLLFVFYLCIWGSIAGAGIYGAQFFGSGNLEGVRSTLRYKFIVGAAVTAVAMTVFALFGDTLAGYYIAAGTSDEIRSATIGYAHSYMAVMLAGLPPFLVTQCYAGTLRKSGRTALPMKAGIAAMLTNFVFNSLLIFGLCGFPKLGVTGAAIATVISRFVELFIVVFFAHRDRKNYGFLEGLYRNFRMPAGLAWQMTSKSFPLLANEFLWAVGQAVLLQCYSGRGIATVAALNICSTVSQLFCEIYLSLGNASQILVGQELGANRLEEAKRTAYRMETLTVLCCFASGALLALCGPFIPMIYNTEDAIRVMATRFIMVFVCCMPIFGFAATAYFILRSGGKAMVTFLFDSCFSWAVSVPAAWLLTHETGLPILTIYLCVNVLDLIKCIIGFALLRRGVWVRNLVS